MNPRLAVFLVSVGATALAAWLARDKLVPASAPASGGEDNAVTTSPQPDPAAIRYRYESDVEFTPWILDTAERLSAVFPGFLMTSGYRSPRSQALAMDWLRTKGGYDRAQFLALYGASDEVINAIYDALVAGDIDGATAILSKNPISAHMRGEAFDVHRGPGALPAGSTAEQQSAADAQYAAAFIAAAKGAGIRAIDEGKGRALHVGA